MVHTPPPGPSADYVKYFPDADLHRKQATFHRQSCINIYQTKDKRYFHLHGNHHTIVDVISQADTQSIGSMNPDPTLDALGLPYELDSASREESWKPYMDKISKIDAADLQQLVSDKAKQAGTICWSQEEYLSSDHYKANAHLGLYQVREHRNQNQAPCWWDDAPFTSSKRPLAGLKVVDITRVIAAPTIARGLAELGASVMRITAPHLTDFSTLHCDLNWGKWNCSLDFRREDDREQLRKLILDADVVVTGYRPYTLDKWGLDEAGILKLCEGREKGIIYVRENCYGWDGPWAYRTGWQQISDAVSCSQVPIMWK
jgi:hypothetical protein